MLDLTVFGIYRAENILNRKKTLLVEHLSKVACSVLVDPGEHQGCFVVLPNAEADYVEEHDIWLERRQWCEANCMQRFSHASHRIWFFLSDEDAIHFGLAWG